VRACPKRWPLLRVAVAERSMVPALHPGDWLLAWRTTRIRPGQIVLAWHPQRPGFLLVKRAAWRVARKGEGEGTAGGGNEEAGGGNGAAGGGWWLLSDNPAAGAVDSARFGPVPEEQIVAVVLVRYWPLGRRRPLV
jgi:hypothetical protein